MRITVLALLLPLLASFCVAACGAPFGSAGARKVIASLPAAPPSWSSLPGLAFELEWVGASGRAESAIVAPGSRLELELPRGAPQAIVARPCSLGLSLEPAGALYPWGLAGGGDPYSFAEGGEEELALDWAGGYVAEVAASLEARGLSPWRFDLPRLKAEAANRVPDPWASLAPAEAARRLAAGSFRADSFRGVKAFPVTLPGPGPWAPESPLAPATVETAEGPRTELGAGLHRFVGQEAELFVSVDGEGAALKVRVPRASSPRRPRRVSWRRRRGSRS